MEVQVTTRERYNALLQEQRQLLAIDESERSQSDIERLADVEAKLADIELDHWSGAEAYRDAADWSPFVQ